MNRNDRAIVALVTLGHAMVHTYELSIPIFVSVWLTGGEFTADAATLGVVTAVGYGLFGVGALPGGVLADTVGSKRLIVACLLGMAGSFALLSVAPSIPVVAVALCAWGAAASVYHPSGLSLISRGVEARGSAFAYHGMAGNLGIALGPLTTALLLLAMDWRTVALVLTVPAILGAALAVRFDVDERAAVADGGAADAGGSKADAVTSWPEFVTGTRRLFASGFVVIFAIVICSGLYYRGVLTFLPDILGGFSTLAPVEFAGRELEPGRYVYAGLLMVGMVGQYVGGRLTNTVPPARALVVGFALLAVIALAFLPVAGFGLVPFLALCAVLGVGLFAVQPLYQAAVAEHTPAGTRGLSYGYTYLGVFGVGALGGVLAGGMLTYASVSVLFLALAGIALTGSLASVVLARR
ncbi:MFS transporter [Haloarchaeobius sp. HRN-SO-5]|uniref:MFS transporter n=1 Tax=Haloarchaeobius sp. HRN-SO-5 TaxID=3446118 RepID=UPI003EBE9672